MSNDAIVVAEDPETGTLAFGPVGAGGNVVVLRDGQRIGGVDKVRTPVAAGPGRILWRDGTGSRAGWLDLSALEMTVATAPKWLVTLTSGAGGIALSDPHYTLHLNAHDAIWREDGALTGLMEMGLDGTVHAHWGLPDDGVGEELTLPGLAPRHEAAPTQDLWRDFPRLIVAEDGATWALRAHRRLAIGHLGTTHFLRWWANGTVEKKGAFDLDRGRFWVAGSIHLAAVDLDTGEVVAAWGGDHPGQPTRHGRTATGWGMRPVPAVMLSEPLFMGDELWVVVRLATKKRRRPGTPATCRVARLQRDSAAFLGFHEGFGAIKSSSDTAALSRLHDGSVLWVPQDAKPRLLPAEGSAWRTTDALHVVGDEPPPRFEAPEVEGYDPTIGRDGLDDPGTLSELEGGARVALARYLLEQGLPDPLFDALFDHDPQAYAPFADALLTLADDALVPLSEAWTHLPEAARGASDTVVAQAVAQLDGATETARTARFRLLCGVGSAAALEAVARLARATPAWAALAHELQLEVPDAGAAAERFTPGAQALLGDDYREDEPEPGPRLASGAPIARGLRCARPLTEVVRLPTDVPAEGLPLMVSTCTACDEVTTGAYRWSGHPPALEGLAPEPACAGAGADPEPASVWIGPFAAQHEEGYRLAGRLGGRPRWVQAPDPPRCEGCEGLPRFVGQVHAARVRKDVADVTLFGFWCDACGRGVQRMQRT